MFAIFCVAFWLVFPGLKGHVLLVEFFSQFQFLGLFSFIYGLNLSAIVPVSRDCSEAPIPGLSGKGGAVSEMGP
jgi:hypothetical protein